MAKKRDLDPYVSVFVDRHGKERHRFRRRGMSCYLPHPSTKEYRAAYQRALQGLVAAAPRTEGRTVNALLPLFYRSIGFQKSGEGWQAIRRQVIEAFRDEYGTDMVAGFEPGHIDVILARKMEKRKVGTRIVGGTAAAERLRGQLLLLFAFAKKLRWIASNPVDEAEEVIHRGEGFYSWKEEDIARFRAHWDLGTKPRLAMELVLWTGARRGNAHKAEPPKDGRITFKAVKTGKMADVAVAPRLADAIAAMPAIGLTTLLVTDYGKPFSVAGFGGWFKDKCIKAGLPQCTLHGLRMALARRAADLDVQQQGIKALGQWSGDREVAGYVRDANQRRLADGALAEVAEWERKYVG